MSLAFAAARAQRAAEAIMVDACTITRPDPSNFGGDPLIIYSGKCRVKMIGQTAREEQELAGPLTDVHRCLIDIPASTTGAKFNDKATITASLNPSMVGFDCFVMDVPTVTAASAQRLVCERNRR